MIAVAVAVAGGIGAVCRVLLDSLLNRHLRTRVPLGLLVVNLAGSLLLGLLVGWAVTHHGGVSEHLRAVLGTGFCGGFTTFSTASVECVRLWSEGGRRDGAAYALATLLGSVAAAAAGMAVGAGVGAAVVGG